MRVLFTIFPAPAHVHPIVPLAWALLGAGHEVRVAIHPDATGLVTSTGLTAVPLIDEQLGEVVEFGNNLDKLAELDDFLSLTGDDNPQWEMQWLKLTRVLVAFRPALPALVRVVRDWQPDLVVWDPFCVPAAVAARVVGAAQVRFLWGRDNIGFLREKSRRTLAERGTPVRRDPVTWLMSPMLEPYGLEYDEELLLGQASIDPMPPGMRLPTSLTHLPIRRVPFNGSASVPDWVQQRPTRPRVCLTLGIGGRGRQLFKESGVSFPDLVHALATLDIELIATIGQSHAAALGTLPENVRVVDYLPLTALLPTCSAIIHHGGGGTFAAAVAHQVPQLTTPMPFWGEEITARYIADHGAGLLIPPATLTPESARDAVARLLTDPAFAEGARTLHKEMLAAPAPGEVVAQLEELVARHPAPSPGIAPV
ncbi:nucleotide disphospho-sugar-binding domain-containing protein [Kitasatospora sp. NPDC006697]|uniref:nucleotide disphospho-sugar-binding domain-containing protein n=1 Tax=Kitasatospora sp. NPDC006697 TaxID=3364020 RepID=UPI0036C1C499